MQNQQLAEKLKRPIIGKLYSKILKNQTQKIHSSLKDNIWGADVANIQLISKYNRRIHFS